MDQTITSKTVNEIYELVSANPNILTSVCMQCSNKQLVNLLKHSHFGHLQDEYGENVFIVLAKSNRYGVLLDNIDTLMEPKNVFVVWFHKNKLSNTTGHYLVNQTNNVSWLKQLIEKYPDYIMLQNNALNSIIHVMISAKHTKTIEILKLLDSNQLQSYVQPLIQTCVVYQNYNIIDYLCTQPYDLHTCSSNGTTPMELAINSKNTKMIQKLLDCGYDVNFTTNNNFNFVGTMDVVMSNVSIFKLIEDKINYHFQNNYLETMAHICVSPLYAIKIPEYIMTKILMSTNLNIQDIENNTVWHYIYHRPDDVYKTLNGVNKAELIKQLHSKCPPKYQLRNNYNQTIKSLVGGFKTPKQLTNISEIKSKRKIQKKNKKIQELPYASNTVYKPDAVTRICYLIHYLTQHKVSTTLVNKVPDVSMSFLNKAVLDLAKLVQVNGSIYEPLMFYELFWMNANINYFPDALKVKQAVNNTKNNIVFWYMTTTTDGKDALHANIVIMNKKQKYVIRFDPHGATNFMKHYSTGTRELDNAVRDYFKIICPECVYVYPDEYNYKFGYQALSEEDNMNYRKIGDPDGYCFAWCYWFLDLVIHNQMVHPKDVVDIGMEKLMNSKYSMLDQIRNYAMMMNKHREKLLLKMGIDCTELYNIVFDESTFQKFQTGVKKYLQNYIQTP